MQGQNKNYVVIVGGAIVGLLVAGAAYKISKPLLVKTCRSLLQEGEESGIVSPSKNVVIEAVAAKIGVISRRIVTVGKLEANQSVMIRSEIPSKIREIPFKEGDDVKEGDILFQFEDSDVVAELNQAQAELDLYEASFGRVSQLQEARIESLKNLDQARAQRDGAKAKVEIAQAKLNKTRILAPFSGSAGLTQYSPGAFVQAAQDLVMLVDNTVLLVDFKIPESYLNDIGVGQVAEIRLDGYPGKVFRALVEAVDSFVDPLSHSISCRASLPNFERSLRSGLFANVSLIIGEKGNALLVPEAALQREGEIEFVWVIQEGKADRRRVVTSTRENAQMEIVAGLRADEIVVTSGQLKLYPGARVHISNMPELYEEKKIDDGSSPSSTEASKAVEMLKSTPPAQEKNEHKKEEKPSIWSRVKSSFSSSKSKPTVTKTAEPSLPQEENVIAESVPALESTEPRLPQEENVIAENSPVPEITEPSDQSLNQESQAASGEIGVDETAPTPSEEAPNADQKM